MQQKVDLLQRTGDKGKIALFITQLPALFQAYQAHAQKLSVNEYLVLNEEDGFNSAVNRGPAAMVDFMRRLEEGFGVSVKGSVCPLRAGCCNAAHAARSPVCDRCTGAAVSIRPGRSPASAGVKEA